MPFNNTLFAPVVSRDFLDSLNLLLHRPAFTIGNKLEGAEADVFQQFKQLLRQPHYTENANEDALLLVAQFDLFICYKITDTMWKQIIKYLRIMILTSNPKNIMRIVSLCDHVFRLNRDTHRKVYPHIDHKKFMQTMSIVGLKLRQAKNLKVANFIFDTIRLWAESCLVVANESLVVYGKRILLSSIWEEYLKLMILYKVDFDAINTSTGASPESGAPGRVYDWIEQNRDRLNDRLTELTSAIATAVYSEDDLEDSQIDSTSNNRRPSNAVHEAKAVQYIRPEFDDAPPIVAELVPSKKYDMPNFESDSDKGSEISDLTENVSGKNSKKSKKKGASNKPSSEPSESSLAQLMKLREVLLENAASEAEKIREQELIDAQARAVREMLAVEESKKNLDDDKSSNSSVILNDDKLNSDVNTSSMPVTEGYNDGFNDGYDDGFSSSYKPSNTNGNETIKRMQSNDTNGSSLTGSGRELLSKLTGPIQARHAIRMKGVLQDDDSLKFGIDDEALYENKKPRSRRNSIKKGFSIVNGEDKEYERYNCMECGAMTAQKYQSLKLVPWNGSPRGEGDEEEFTYDTSKYYKCNNKFCMALHEKKTKNKFIFDPTTPFYGGFGSRNRTLSYVPSMSIKKEKKSGADQGASSRKASVDQGVPSRKASLDQGTASRKMSLDQGKQKK